MSDVAQTTGESSASIANSAGTSTHVNLVLQGGGVKGIGLAGAISVLQHHGYIFDRVAGTSAGAIVGSLVAAGITSDALYELMASLDYTKFRDDTRLDDLPLLGHGLALWFEHGIYAGNYVHDWIEGELEKLGVRTFADLKLATPAQGVPVNEQYKLVVVTSDVSRGCLLRLPWSYGADRIDPDEQLVADAVRASMSIPFFYRPFKLAVPGGSSFCVDGGMLSNFPIAVFEPESDGGGSATTVAPAVPTIGIKLSARQAPNVVEYDVHSTFSLATAMLGTMQGWYDQMHVDDPEVIKRTIFVDTFGVNATDFTIDRPTQERLYQSGQKAAEAFLTP